MHSERRASMRSVWHMTSRIASLASLVLFSISAIAQQAPPPGSAAPADEAGPGVARISMISGDVSVKRGDSGDAVAAVVNAPLLVADTIATGPEARAEVQFDSGHRFRLGSEVEARLAEIQNGKYRMELAHGTVALSVLRDSASQAEVSTPNISMRPTQRGLYRVTVSDDGQTTVTVRAGEAEIYSEKGTEHLTQGQSMIVRGNADDPEFQIVAGIQRDEWDSWNEQRDQALSHADSYRYVNPEIPGAEELDGQGTWVNDPAYGKVWAPRVSPDWAPYREGRWTWEDYYGWTWVSNDPWGWAPYHYGNWYYGSVGWCWYPGIYSRPVFWRPALVAFFGFGGGGFGGVGFGVGFGFGGFGHVGWLPLAPFEPFHPWYGRGFGGRGFAGNYNITNVNITNIYRNARVNGAISGVAAASFTGGRFGAITRVNQEQVRTAGLVRGALPIAPTANNLRFSDRATSVTPTHFGGTNFSSQNRSSIASPVPFSQQRQAIQQSAQRYSQSVNSPGTRSYSTGQPSVGGNSSWGRFGAPGATSSAPSGRRAASPVAAQSAPGWARFGSPSGPSSVNRSSYGRNVPPPATSVYGQNSQSLRLSQPMVHSRSSDQPGGGGYSSGQGYNAPRYNTPAYNAPRYNTPSYNAPRSYNSPSYNSPSYNAPRSSGSPGYSAPRSYSAPAASHNSGGGSQHTAPVSHSSNGGGGGSSSHHR